MVDAVMESKVVMSVVMLLLCCALSTHAHSTEWLGTGKAPRRLMDAGAEKEGIGAPRAYSAFTGYGTRRLQAEFFACGNPIPGGASSPDILRYCCTTSGATQDCKLPPNTPYSALPKIQSRFGDCCVKLKGIPVVGDSGPPPLPGH